MHIRISQLKDRSISVEQARYDTYVVAKYLDISKIKKTQGFIRLPYLSIWYSLNKYTLVERRYINYTTQAL